MLAKKMLYVIDVKRVLMPDLSSEIDKVIILWSVGGLIIVSFSIFVIVRYISKKKSI
jgi:hypothetical protein